MSRFTGPRPATAAALALLGWWAASSPPDAQAATEELLAAAAACAQIDWRDQAGAERARTYRQAVACLKRLYVRVARGPDALTAFDTELTNRLDPLETAYRASRDTVASASAWVWATEAAAPSALRLASSSSC